MKLKSIIAVIAFLFVVHCESEQPQSRIYINFNNYKAANKAFTRDNVKTMNISVYENEYTENGNNAGNLIYTKNFASDTGTAEFVVPSGNNRIFVAEAKEANNLVIFRGISEPVNLVSGETATVNLTMVDVTETATVNFSLKDTSNNIFDPAAAANLLENNIKISVVTSNNAIFSSEVDQDLLCNYIGDYDEKIITSSDFSLTLPANIFIMIVATGYNSDTSNGKLTTWVRYYGGYVFYGTNILVSGSTNVIPVDIVMYDATDDPEDDTDVANGWEDLCECP